MKHILALLVAIAAVSMFGTSSASAQGFNNGYQFGAGINGNCGGFARGFQREQPPYFAKFPPVYYSHIVKRPYGVSPYAAPAGIAPVEMSVPAPVVKKNPFFGMEVDTVSDEVEKTDSQIDNKTTFVPNPYMTEKTVGISR